MTLGETAPLQVPSFLHGTYRSVQQKARREGLRCVKKLGAAHTLEALMVASCDWAMEGWCPDMEGSVRSRLEKAVERMARATREDCLEAMLRQMPRALFFARGLKHQKVVADPSFQRERLSMLDARAFERVSGACTSDLLEKIYDWDHELGLQ